jgi:hypothetical protein
MSGSETSVLIRGMSANPVPPSSVITGSAVATVIVSDNPARLSNAVESAPVKEAENCGRIDWQPARLMPTIAIAARLNGESVLKTGLPQLIGLL